MLFVTELIFSNQCSVLLHLQSTAGATEMCYITNSIAHLHFFLRLENILDLVPYVKATTWGPHVCFGTVTLTINNWGNRSY